jgi:3D (Asp-Asp-Asp) domain-containing protein
MATLYDTWQAEAAAVDTAEVIPLASLVGVQYGAILAADAYLAAGDNR